MEFCMVPYNFLEKKAAYLNTGAVSYTHLDVYKRQGPWESFLDGVCNGLGYAKILIIVAFFRELFGSGTLLGFNILNYEPIQNIGYVNNG